MRLSGGSLVASVLALSLIASPVGLGCRTPGEDVDEVGASSEELSVAELQAAVAALDVAIAELHAHVASLEGEIGTLDSSNAAKAAEVDRLVRDIEARKREVQDQYERDRQNALLFCMFGACNVGMVSLMMAFDNDGRLKQLERDLDAAKQQQEQMHTELDAYRTKKEALETKLVALKTTEQSLVALLAATDTGATKLVRLARRADRMTALKDNLGAQARTLGDVKTLATNLGSVIDTALVKVATASQKADQLAEASRKATYDLLRILTAGDPNAAAQQWLDAAVTKKTKELLREIGWDPDGFVDQLVARAFPGQEQTAMGKLLRDQLRAAIGTG
jgi:predicted  nucleic acid-binding Zn-ribbon protein